MFRVFLIDDEAWALIGLERLIPWEEEGFIIAAKFNKADDAWRAIDREKPDVIVTDIRMPGMSGVDLLKAVRDKNLDTQIILISGYADFHHAQEAIRHGAFEYLLKPVRREQLLDCVQRLNKVLKQRPKKKECVQLSDQIIDLVEGNLQDTPTLALLAEKFSLSQSSISQTLKKQTGKNYSELVLDIKMEKARELLEQTNDSIVEISKQVGFSDQFYFSKTFKRVEGISPNAYRKQKLN